MNRTETPWLIVLVHAPLYSSYVHHYMEGETMRVMYEPWFVEYKVDVVFAGHVHAYERSVSAPYPQARNLTAQNLSVFFQSSFSDGQSVSYACSFFSSKLPSIFLCFKR